jgi:hypothetical protein
MTETHRGLAPDWTTPTDHHGLQGLCRAPECRASGAIALALTIQQPWADAIAHGDKRTENRTWPIPPQHMGARILLHAGKAVDRRAVLVRGRDWPDHRGAVIGTARLDSCHQATTSGLLCCAPWGHPSGAFAPTWHWRLTEVRALELPIEAKGFQKLWRPPAGLVRAVRSQFAGSPFVILEEEDLC